MANVKISALPSYTGSAADLRWFVMNNSGETITFKYSGYSSPYKWNNSTNGVSEVNYTERTEFNTQGGTNTISGTGPHMVIGSGNTVGGDSNFVVIGYNNTAGYTAGIGKIGTFIYGQNNYSTNGRWNTIFGWSNNVSGLGSQAFGDNHNVSGTNAAAFGNNNSNIGYAGMAVGNSCAVGGECCNSFGNNNDINAGNYQGIWGGQNNSINSAQNNNSIVGGENNSIGLGVASTTITAAYNNTNIQGSNLGFIAGTQDNTLTALGYTFALVGGGYNTVNNQNASAGNAMYSSYFCNDTTSNSGGASINTFFGAHTSTITGWGKLNNITNSYSSTITNNPSTDVGEWYNKIDSSSGSSINYSRQSQIFGGVDNTIDQVANAVILGGSGNTINGEFVNVEKYNMIFGGSGNTIFNSSTDQIAQTILNSRNTTLQNGGERITAIGLSGRTINGAAVGTTFVENLYAYRQIVNETKNNGSVDATGFYIDLREGQKQSITITGSGVNNIYFTGYTEGGGLKLKVTNTSTGSLNFVDGASPNVWRLPATMNPQTANGTDIYVFESFENGNLWLVSHTQNLS